MEVPTLFCVLDRFMAGGPCPEVYQNTSCTEVADILLVTSPKMSKAVKPVLDGVRRDIYFLCRLQTLSRFQQGLLVYCLMSTYKMSLIVLL